MEDEAIDDRIIAAILAGRIRPGTRLGEAMLGEIFGVSRTRVREAMMRLETRGIVTVSARRGWFVVEPSAADARAAFEARRIVETGLMLAARALPAAALDHLKRHVAEERRAIRAGEVGNRTCLLGDFHIHLAEALGNPLVTAILRDLTARTVLVSMLYQSADDAARSSEDHDRILAALEAGDTAAAARLMADHIDGVEAGLDLGTRRAAPADLRDALAPSARPRRPAASLAAATPRARSRKLPQIEGNAA